MKLSLDKTEMITSTSARISLNTPCIICRESIELTSEEEMAIRYGNNIVKVCGKCKQAVIKMRETIEHEDKGE